MLWQRLILGPAMIAALLALLYLDGWLERLDVTGTPFQPMLGGAAHPPGGLAMLAVSLVLIALAGVEFARLARAKGLDTHGPSVALAAILALLASYLLPLMLADPLLLPTYASVLVVVLAGVMLSQCWGSRTQGVLVGTGVTVLGMLYLGVLPAFYLLMRGDHAVWVVAGAILVTKACDIGAYFTGRAIGRHKLIPWLSPGKTWEGLVGGLALAGLTGLALAAVGNHFESVGQWVGSGAERRFEPMHYALGWAALGGIVLGGVGHLGDLAMSLLKRDAAVKDTGRTIPGFGGVLDVLDSPLAAAPAAYWLAHLALASGESGAF